MSENTHTRYSVRNATVDFVMTVLTAGNWLVWSPPRYLRTH